MQSQLDMICTLTGCDLEMAITTFNETKDVTLAIDKILFKTAIPVKKKQVKDSNQEQIDTVREYMEEFDRKMDLRKDSTVSQYATSSSQRAREVSISRPGHLAEMVLQNNCSHEYQLPVLQEEAEKRETACQSQSGLIYDLLSNGQT